MIKKNFKILIFPGLHTRPGAMFVKFCNTFKSDITLNIRDESIDGKSMISLMKTAPSQFLDIEVVIEGTDEEEFMSKLTNWQTEAYKDKEEFDNDDIKEYLMDVFEELWTQILKAKNEWFLQFTN